MFITSRNWSACTAGSLFMWLEKYEACEFLCAMLWKRELNIPEVLDQLQ